MFKQLLLLVLLLLIPLMLPLLLLRCLVLMPLLLLLFPHPKHDLAIASLRLRIALALLCQGPHEPEGDDAWQLPFLLDLPSDFILAGQDCLRRQNDAVCLAF